MVFRLAFSWAVWGVSVVLVSASEPMDSFQGKVKPFLEAHCVKCHGANKQSGDVRLDNLDLKSKDAASRWAAVRDQLRDGLMPPTKEPRPDPAKVRELVSWATVLVGTKPARMPNQGNLIPNDLIFGKPASSAAASPPRTWRLNPDAYLAIVRSWGVNPTGMTQPFTLIDERGIRDFSSLYSVEVPETEILLRNARDVVDYQTLYDNVDGQIKPKNNSVREFVALMDPKKTPTDAQVEEAVRVQYRIAIGRKPGADDLARYVGLYHRCLKEGDSPGAVKTVLQAVLLKTDAIFRQELGLGAADGKGRRMLSPLELSKAVSFSLGVKRTDSTIARAAEMGHLTTREQVAAHVKRILDDPRADQSRIAIFFHEYFEYQNATEVFKEKPKHAQYYPGVHVRDTDLLIAHILNQDKDVFRQLLTTPLTFANGKFAQNKKPGETAPIVKAELYPPNKDKKTGLINQLSIDGIYGFAEWPKEQPAKVPDETRIGVLMQPSWLMAWGTNFDNDPVRRGRWIRERLLGGTVPDIPIGVAAQVPDDPHRTFRERLTVTRQAFCWKCHQKMDELGLPFENFDHYGIFRKTEKVEDPEATAKNVDKKGKSLGKVYREAPLDTTGFIRDSGDPKLDGPVANPREMIRKIADSDLARQVFIRHAFRFFLGRNESLADAKTLQDADAAYLASGGSFKALVTSLLTSDAFLYRTEIANLTSKAGDSK